MAADVDPTGLRRGMVVLSSDGEPAGWVAKVWHDVGVGESGGAVGSVPLQGAQAVDPRLFA